MAIIFYHIMKDSLYKKNNTYFSLVLLLLISYLFPFCFCQSSHGF